MLYLHKTPEDTHTAIHGVHYHKGLEDGRHCGRVHKYHTRNCRPVLYTDADMVAMPPQGRANYVPYSSLSDDEILELGPPVFFRTPTGRAETGQSVTYDPRANVIAQQTWWQRIFG